MKWELKHTEKFKEAEELAASGWDLVSVTNFGFYFKRPFRYFEATFGGAVCRPEEAQIDPTSDYIRDARKAGDEAMDKAILKNHRKRRS
jgi:hypothetical protein